MHKIKPSSPPPAPPPPLFQPRHLGPLGPPHRVGLVRPRGGGGAAVGEVQAARGSVGHAQIEVIEQLFGRAHRVRGVVPR